MFPSTSQRVSRRRPLDENQRVVVIARDGAHDPGLRVEGVVDARVRRRAANRDRRCSPILMRASVPSPGRPGHNVVPHEEFTVAHAALGTDDGAVTEGEEDAGRARGPAAADTVGIARKKRAAKCRIRGSVRSARPSRSSTSDCSSRAVLITCGGRSRSRSIALSRSLVVVARERRGAGGPIDNDVPIAARRQAQRRVHRPRQAESPTAEGGAAASACAARCRSCVPARMAPRRSRSASAAATRSRAGASNQSNAAGSPPQPRMSRTVPERSTRWICGSRWARRRSGLVPQPDRQAGPYPAGADRPVHRPHPGRCARSRGCRRRGRDRSAPLSGSPLSITAVMPGTVSDVSAMLVASTMRRRGVGAIAASCAAASSEPWSSTTSTPVGQTPGPRAGGNFTGPGSRTTRPVLRRSRRAACTASGHRHSRRVADLREDARSPGRRRSGSRRDTPTLPRRRASRT